MINWFGHEYPYSNFHELNLDWIINTIKKLVDEVNNFVVLNAIKYADPIQWNITTQYEKNTVVIEPNSGTAYISVQPVPSGVGINNTDYWSVIFTLDVISANKNITLRDDANNMLATFESIEGDWLLWNGTLYKVTRTIEIGNAYVVDYNITRFTVEMYLKTYIETVVNQFNVIIGDLDDLTTEDKTSIVNAINELVTSLGDLGTTIGDLDDLTTEDKTSIVNAINELVTNLGDLDNDISDISNSIGDLDDLETTDKTSIVNAINETLKTGNYVNIKDVGAVGDGVTDDTQAFISCFANNDCIFIPDGTYIVNGDVILHDNMHIIGVGTIKSTVEVQSVLVGNNVENVTIEGITFENGTPTAVGYSELYGDIFITGGENIKINAIKSTGGSKLAIIILDNVTNFTITNCDFEDTGYSGITCQSRCYNGLIADNHIKVSNYTGFVNTYAIALSCYVGGSGNKTNECKYITIDRNTVECNIAHWEALDTHSGDHIVFSNNIVKGFLHGIAVTHGNGVGAPTNIIVQDNYIDLLYLQPTDNSKMLVAIEIATDKASPRKNIVVSGNTIKGCYYTYISDTPVGYGIWIYETYGCVVSNNKFEYACHNCIVVDDSGELEIVGNTAIGIVYGFIYLKKISGLGMIDIKDNVLNGGKNFYTIESGITNIAYVSRANNKVVNAYWKDNSATPTSNNAFVPDVVGSSPAGSNYRPKGEIAYNGNPATNGYIGWVSNGSTWLPFGKIES